MHLSSRDIARHAGGEILRGDPEAIASSWSFDSRALLSGACFVALAGQRDGHDFVADAFHAGAQIALVSRDVRTTEGTLVRVDDTLSALQQVARAVRRERSALHVVGVAGSTGKTSTKDVLAAVLTTRGVSVNPESHNNEFGLPVTLLNTPSVAEIVVTEMGERFPGDIAQLCDIARPDVGVVTNVGLAHAEHLGGADGAAAVLAELLEGLPREGLAVLNADDQRTPFLAARTAARVVTVGFSGDADYQIVDAELGADLRPTFCLDDQRFDVALRGAHQVHNAAMAAVVARRAFDLSWDDIAAGMRVSKASKWRMEVLERADDVVILNDAYNANPDSMEAALRALAHVPVRRRIAVLGDMRELGSHGADAHAQVGRRAAELGIDVVVGVGEGGAEIAAAARAAGADARVVADAHEAHAVASELVGPGDAVLVKASRALGLQRVAEALIAEGAAP